MAKGTVSTLCRTVGVVGVWWASSAFLTNGLPQMGVRMDHEALPFYVVSILIVVLGAIVATAILWLGGRPKWPRDYKGRAFEVIPSTPSPATPGEG